MQLWNDFPHFITENWPIWLVSAVLIVAAIIDGWKLKVPNWITFPFVVGGWIYSTAYFGWEGFGWSLVGTCVGLALLLPAYAIGGMGAGDVKLLAGVGAWIWGTNTFYAFCVSAVIGGAIAVAMVFVETELAPSLAPIMGDLFRNLDNPRTKPAIRDRRRAKEFNVAVALRNSYCHWNNYLFYLYWNAAMNLPILSKLEKTRPNCLDQKLNAFPKSGKRRG